MGINWSIFTLSFLVGAAVLATGVVFLRRRFLHYKLLKEHKKELDAMKELHARVAIKIKKVKEIIDRQIELADLILQPKDVISVHGVTKDRYDLIKEHEELEKEKITILNDVVYKDGIDTSVSVLNPNTKETETMKLSEFLKYLEQQHKKVNAILEESAAKEELKSILDKLKKAKSKTNRSGTSRHKIVKKETDHGIFYSMENDDDDDNEGTIH
jgi:hypothetical protein